MASRFVRASHYRHVFGQPAKPEGQFTGTKHSSSDGNLVYGNTQYVAIPQAGGGGPVQILKLDTPGRIGVVKQVTAGVHKGVVIDISFNPFYENIYASASDDAFVKLVKIPDEFNDQTIEAKDALVTLEGHQKKVNEAAFNPVADNILASHSPDNTVRIWDVSTSSEVLSYEVENPFHFEWNKNGSLGVVSARDKQGHLFDPRQSGAAQKFAGFGGAKKSSILFGNFGYLVGVGPNDRNVRQIKVWDSKNLDKPLSTQDLDSASGAFIPHLDNDNGILYLAGKGESRIQYYEITQEAPYAHFLTAFTDTTPTVGLAYLPKRACDVKSCEILKVLRLLENSLVPVSFQVPRKSDMFQKDLYPEAYAGIAGLEAKAWLGGENAEPKTVSMDPKAKAAAGEPAAKKEIVLKKSYAELEAENEALKKRVAELEAQLKP